MPPYFLNYVLRLYLFVDIVNDFLVNIPLHCIIYFGFD